MTTNSALLCLALNIYHEARGEPELGQIAVAMVTMNRADWLQENICSVVYKDQQFSWTNSRSELARQEHRAWRKAKTLAEEVINGDYPDVTLGATHFHSHRVLPSWSGSLEKTVRIGRHIFYTQAR